MTVFPSFSLWQPSGNTFLSKGGSLNPALGGCHDFPYHNLLLQFPGALPARSEVPYNKGSKLWSLSQMWPTVHFLWRKFY